MIYDTIKEKRTIRLFENKEVPYEILKKCVDAARMSSSARNSQPLEYIIVDDPKLISKLLPLITFGGLITEDKKPRKVFEPKAIIIVIVKKGFEEYYKYDAGIAVQNITLVAYENSLGSCVQGAINKTEIGKELGIPEEYFVDLVISIGYPAEQPIIEETEKDPKYYREKDVLHVLKRKLSKVLHKNEF